MKEMMGPPSSVKSKSQRSLGYRGAMKEGGLSGAEWLDIPVNDFGRTGLWFSIFSSVCAALLFVYGAR